MALEFLGALAVKSVLIAVLAWIGFWMLRRRAAHLRHLWWTTAMYCLLLTPLLATVLPRWYVRDAAVPPEPAVTVAAVQVTPAERPPTEEPERRAAETIGEEDRPSEAAGFSWSVSPQALLWVWALGFCAMLLRDLRARLNAATLTAQAIPVTDGGVCNQFAAVLRRAGFEGRVRLMHHHGVSGPMVVGLFRHTVLLPTEALVWPAQQLHTALLHEIGHLVRRDLHHQFVTRIVCAVYWYNPLVLFAAARMAHERETATDDFVLATGLKASDYALHLLAAAGCKPTRTKRPLEAVAMANGSLKNRLTLILDPTTKRRVGRVPALTAVLLLSALVLPVVAMAPFDQPPAPPKPATAPKPVIAEVAVVPEAAPAPVAAPKPQASPKPVVAPVPEAAPPAPLPPKPSIAARVSSHIHAVVAPVAEVVHDMDVNIDPDWDDWDEEETELERRIEAMEDELDDLLDDFEDRVEDMLENLEDDLENWVDDIEDRYEDVNDNLVDQVETAADDLEDRLDDLEDRLDDKMDILEDQYEIDEDNLPADLEEHLKSLKQELNALAEEMEQELKILTEEFKQVRKDMPR